MFPERFLERKEGKKQIKIYNIISHVERKRQIYSIHHCVRPSNLKHNGRGGGGQNKYILGTKLNMSIQRGVPLG